MARSRVRQPLDLAPLFRCLDDTPLWTSLHRIYWLKIHAQRSDGRVGTQSFPLSAKGGAFACRVVVASIVAALLAWPLFALLDKLRHDED